MKKTISSNRLTIDLTDQNKEILEDLKTKLSSPFGAIVNMIIGTFCNIPKDIREDLITYCKSEVKLLSKKIDATSPYQARALSDRIQIFLDIITVLNRGIRPTISEINDEVEMMKIPIKNGYAICPNDWIIVNPEEASKSTHAIIIECMNSSKYGIPHFLYFSIREYGNDYDDTDAEFINHKCAQAWSEFNKIMDLQVTPIKDPEHPGMMLNYEEWSNAPIIGHFHMYVQGDSRYPRDYRPPLGAQIVRNQGTVWEE